MVHAVLAVGPVVDQVAVEHDIVDGPAKGRIKLAAQLMGHGVHQNLAFLVLRQTRGIGNSHGIGKDHGVHQRVQTLRPPDNEKNGAQQGHLHEQRLEDHSNLGETRQIETVEHGSNSLYIIFWV